MRSRTCPWVRPTSATICHRCDSRRGSTRLAAQEIGAADATLAVFLHHGLAEPKIVELQRREQHRGRVQAEAVDDMGPQGFGRFGAIRYPGVKRVHRQPGARVEFGPLVRVHEVARIRLDEQRRARGQDVLQAIDQLDPQRVVPEVLQLAQAHETMPVARGPRVAEGEGQVVIDLLEAELVAQDALVEIAAGREAAIVLPVEWLPGDLLAVQADPQDRLAAGVRIALVNPVDGNVRKQRGFRRNAAGGQASG